MKQKMHPSKSNSEMNEVVTTENRGVNITSEDFEEPEREQVAPPASSTNRLKVDIQNVIDIIETNTPHFFYPTSSLEGDNDSLVSSVTKAKQVGIEQSSQNDLFEFVSVASEPCNTASESSYGRIHSSIPYMSTNCTCPHCQRHVSINCHKDQQACNNKQKKFALQTLFDRFIGKDRTVPADLYKINITQSRNDTSPPKRFVFDLIEEVPKHVISTGTNTKHIVNESLKKSAMKCNHARNVCHSTYSGMVLTHVNKKGNNKFKHQSCNKNLYKKKLNCTKTANDSTRMDVYYFDHGNAAYYQTTDAPPAIKTEFMAERTESYAKKFWAEFFGTLYIGCAFITTFILQFFRFIIHGIIQPLTIALLQLISDYFLKPCLVTLFNAIVQPPLIFIYNIATSLRDLCDPISEGMGYFMRECGVLCKAIRLFEIKRENSTRKCNEENDEKCDNANEFAL